MTHSNVRFQVNPASVPSIPSWMEEVAAVAHILTQTGIISAIEEHVQFARARFGTDDTIDFVIMLFSYALSGEPTIAAFYDRLAPFTHDFLALFQRQRLPSRSALSRFLAALDEKTVEALRTQFLHDLFERTTPFSSPGGLWDRLDQQYVVVDVDGTRQVARQRALPHLPTLPEPRRRFAQVAASGYTGRKRGEVVRTRTTLLQSHTHQGLGTFGGPGTGDIREGLKRACQVAATYATRHQLQVSQILMRLDGGYGDTAVLSDVLALGLGLIARSRDYALLGRPEVLAVLSHPPAVRCTHPESGVIRDLYDCPSIRLLPGRPCGRLLIATHPATDDPPKIGQKRNGMVYELFVSTLLAPTVTAKDLLDLYLHRGSFEIVLADEDLEQEPDRWCSHTPCGQEFWQIISQWVWNLRLEFGQNLSPPPRFAPLNLHQRANRRQRVNRRWSTKLRRRANRRQRVNRRWSTPLRRPTNLPMAHLNGHDPHLPAVFPDQLLLHNRMGRCFAQPGKCSRWRNEDLSVLTRCVCRMRRVLMMAVSVSYVRSVKQVAPSKPGGSVPCIGPFHLPLLRPRSPDAARLPLLPVLPCCGVIGLAAKSGASGSTPCDPKPSR